MKDYSPEYKREASLIYSIIVAGKSATFADKATVAFLDALRKPFKSPRSKTPFQLLRMMPVSLIEECARYAKTGNYGKLARACYELANKQIDLLTVTPEKLETIHGIGPKTSRFFIMWTRPAETYAALDVHILRWLRNNGYPHAPKATPQNKKMGLIQMTSQF